MAFAFRFFPPLRPAAGLALVLVAAPLASAAPPAEPSSVSMPDNPLLRESTLPFHYPRFDLIKNELFAPAFDWAMTDHLREIDAIAHNPEAPSFDNTIVAMEKAGLPLGRVTRTFLNLTGCNTNPELQKLQRVMAPRLAAHSDAILLNPDLFARVQSLYDRRDTLKLDPESSRLLWRYHRDFVRAGAKLSAPNQARLKALNAEIATLQTTFSQNVLKEINASALVVETPAELAGLTAAQIAGAAAAAKADGHEGKYELRLENTTGQPPLSSLTNREVRRRLMAESLARGSRGGEFDNRATVSRLVRLRAEHAVLLGYPNHAAYIVDEQTAGSVDKVNQLLAELAPPAVANARREAADMQAIIDHDQGGFPLEAADWSFYSEKVRAARYAFDESQLKPYFELNHVLLDGVFYAANREYGLTFKERHDLPVYEPTVRVFDVFDADGRQLAIFIADYFARPSKNGGAWMNAYVNQSGLLGTQPVVANHLNIPPPAAGQPALLTFDQVRTMFHEFGHALHGMFSQVRYPRFAGTQVPRDFVEFPSQVNEMWASWPEVVKHYAKHYQTGEPLPPALLGKMLATMKFNQGFLTTEYLAATLLDQAWHQIPPEAAPDADGVVPFEEAALKKYGVDFAPVPPRYRSTYFSHVFAGGYSAGYYSYIWAEVLDADSVEWIKQHGGLTRENGDRFRSTLLSRGGSEDALQLFRNFTGRDPYLEPLLVRRGLDQAGAKK
ncbi:MAG TPA: M3 family metallopeptidase [Candidatus Didemnitutus sp.]|jgi:peptidyl-dipeptidase Dcp